MDPLVIEILPEGKWHRSEFPHPLLTLDFDSLGNLIAVVAVGSIAEKIAHDAKRWDE